MPIYEYVCQDCGSQFELIRRMKEADTPIDCQACHSQHVNRMISVFVAKSGERTVAGGGGGCAGCGGGGGGGCAGCKH
jgi:putative FmdB family regulatory protein